MNKTQPPWLLDPDARRLFSDFPIPLALVAADGRPVALNTRFAASYHLSSVTPSQLQGFLEAGSSCWQDVRLPSTGGGQITVRLQALPANQQTVLLVLSGDNHDRDITLLRQQLQDLEQLVSTDPLTGAWNRAHLDRVIEVELNRSTRYRQPLAQILIDVDHFKRINDRHGHLAGDGVLREIVHTVRENIRGTDLLFRWGGEEFLVMTPSTSYRSAATVAKKILAAVASRRFAVGEMITVSLGVAERLPEEDSGTFFRRADKALYAAKNAGRNRVVVDKRGSSDQWTAKPGAGIMALQWSEACECGDRTIDSQHYRLFELANSLIGIVLDAASERPTFNEALNVLLEHIAGHFADEEAILESKGYAHLRRHRRAHAGLLQRARALKQRAEAGEIPLGQLVEFIARDVVAGHLLAADRDFFPLFQVAGGDGHLSRGPHTSVR